jgi:hypothetical protein
MFKSFIAGVMLLSAISSQAITTTFQLHNAAASAPYATNIVDRGILLYSLTINNGATLPVSYAILDAPATNSTRGPAQGFFSTGYSNGAYTTYITFVTNITKTITHFSGLTTNLVASNVQFSVAQTVAASTNSYRVIASGTLGATNSVTIPLSATLHVVYGLTITNSLSTNSTVSYTYSPAL